MAEVEKQTKINITGADKELVSKTASEIKSIKPVEPYKAKGIKEKIKGWFDVINWLKISNRQLKIIILFIKKSLLEIIFCFRK